MPLFCGDNFIGVVLSNENNEEYENTFLFLLKDGKVVDFSLNANFSRLFYQRKDKMLYFLATDDNSIMVFQLEPDIKFEIEEIIIVIPFGTEIPRKF